MGSTQSSEQDTSKFANGERQGSNSSDGDERPSASKEEEVISRTDNDAGGMSEIRLAEFLHTLQRIAKLQRDAAEAQIESRETRRDTFNKREDVWFWDNKFMGEVQRLTADGKLNGFDELTRIAKECQAARDQLGPSEQEGIEAEQRWEGRIWKLQQAEDNMRAEFRYEFLNADALSGSVTSTATSSYKDSIQSMNEDGPVGTNFTEENLGPHGTAISVASSSSFSRLPLARDFATQSDDGLSRESILSDLTIPETARPKTENGKTDWNSRTEEIDELRNWTPLSDITGPALRLPGEQHSSLEFYPQLITDFNTGRDRINKWLENTALTSRFEGFSLFSALKTQLEAENYIIPSNWAQLVIAFWNSDGAAQPQKLLLGDNGRIEAGVQAPGELSAQPTAGRHDLSNPKISRSKRSRIPTLAADYPGSKSRPSAGQINRTGRNGDGPSANATVVPEKHLSSFTSSPPKKVGKRPMFGNWQGEPP